MDQDRIDKLSYFVVLAALVIVFIAMLWGFVTVIQWVTSK